MRAQYKNLRETSVKGGSVGLVWFGLSCNKRDKREFFSKPSRP